MARRSDHTRDELKNLAIQEGYKIISEEGIAEFGARKLSRAMGYTVGTLYNVFGSYDVMMLHIQARILDDFYEMLEHAAARVGDKKPLHALASAYLDYSRRHENVWAALFGRPALKEIPDWYQDKLLRFIRLVEKAILPLVNHDMEQATRAASTLWASIHGICVLTLSGKLELLAHEDAEAMAHGLIDNYLRGLNQ